MSAQQLYRSAICNSMGIDAPHDLGASLNHLEQAAQGGHRGAQTELAALVGKWLLVRELSSAQGAGKVHWSRLRAAVDVAGWLRVPEGRILSATPCIAAVPGYLSAPICDWLIRVGQPHLQRADVYDDNDGLRHDAGRDNDSAVLDMEVADTVVGFVRSRIAALASVPIAALEPTQVLRYEVGQKFGVHVDFLDVSKPGQARDVEEQGQRGMTVLVYLNEDYQGGETAFPDLRLSFKGRKGDALMFWSLQESGEPDWRTRHIGTAPTRGVKWLLSQWIRCR